MKIILSTLAIALAFSFTPTPAYALDDLAKCRVYNAKIKMNYAKCLELDKLLVEKGKAAKRICDSKRTASLDKATDKFVIKLGVSDAACGIDSETADGDQALQWLASGDGSLTAEQEAALAGTAADNITSNDQSVCEAAGGTWESSTCTAGSSYNCTIGAMCSAWATWENPEELQNPINNYVGHTAASSGCDSTSWDNITALGLDPSFAWQGLEGCPDARFACE